MLPLIAPLFLSTLVRSQVVHPNAMIELCGSKDNIFSWTDIPHDWRPEDKNGDGEGRYVGKDWWYWGDDWKQKIADGDVDMEPLLREEFAVHENPEKTKVLGTCNVQPIRDMPNVRTVSECRRACAFEYSTQFNVREKCQWFSHDQGSKRCLLYSRCGWPFQNVANVDSEEVCWGTESRAKAIENGCSWGENQVVWKTYRIVDIYPAGFQSFSLREFNQPPLCIHVPNSSDKKVEVMIETETNDSRICIMDGRDLGVYTNDVGNVRTCDNGKLYSCFTAATKRSQNANQDFYFYISCEGSCEAADVDLWIRLRKSQRSWDQGKSDWASDIEYWCEHERGTEAGEEVDASKIHPEFQYPSELLPRQPREYPYRITKGMDRSSAAANSIFVALFCAFFAAVQLL